MSISVSVDTSKLNELLPKCLEINKRLSVPLLITFWANHRNLTRTKIEPVTCVGVAG